MSDPRHVETVCRHCGQPLNASEVIDDAAARPSAGDVSICMGCGSISMFNADLTLRAPTGVERNRLESDRGVQRIRLAVAMLQADRMRKRGERQ